MLDNVLGTVLDKVLGLCQRIVMWLSSKPKRLRLRGARIQVVAFVCTREPAILLAQSAYHDMWMPPQEGVRLNEAFVAALHRCLKTECGLKMPTEPESVGPLLHLRSIRFQGVLDLPPHRHGERPVADDAVGTPLESVVLKKKAYWMATVLVRSRDSIAPKADGRELLDLQWFSFADALQAFEETNHPEKAALLSKALHACERDLLGGPSPAERRGGAST